MIRVYRSNEPSNFPQQRLLWEKEFKEAANKPKAASVTEVWRKIRSRKAMKEYVDLLFSAFHDKCAFCESNSKPTSPLHIEHYRPKSTSAFQSYMFDWNNWLVACMTCNGNKGEYFDDCSGYPCLLDPTVEEPNEHIDFRSAQMIPKTTRGKKTIDQIRLNRVDLVKARKLWLLNIQSLMELAVSIPEAHKPAVREYLIWAMQDDAPYAAMVRTYLRQQMPKLANPVTPHPVFQFDEVYGKLIDALNKRSQNFQFSLE
jgi:uncharacterized protein (TIGR02646 family)